MLLHDYTSMEMFNKNFFKDWRKVMSNKERELITDLKKCDFKAMHAYFTEESEKRKGRSKEEKQVTRPAVTFFCQTESSLGSYSTGYK